MAWRHGSVVALVGLMACNRANPAFGDDGPAAGTAETGKVTVSGDGTTDAADTILDGPLDTATSVDTLPPDTTGGDVTTSGDPPLDTGKEPTTGEPACMTVFPDPWSFEAIPPLPNIGCTELQTFVLALAGNAGPNTLYVAPCEVCPCVAPGLETEINFDVPTPVLPDCFYLHVQSGIDATGNCAVEAYSMEAANDVIVHVVSNVVDPAIPEPFDFSLAPVPWVPCGENCDQPQSGYYGLVTGTTTLAPEGMPTAVPGATGGQYQVVNVSSGIDDACHEVARWHSRVPG